MTKIEASKEDLPNLSPGASVQDVVKALIVFCRSADEWGPPDPMKVALAMAKECQISVRLYKQLAPVLKNRKERFKVIEI